MNTTANQSQPHPISYTPTSAIYLPTFTSICHRKIFISSCHICRTRTPLLNYGQPMRLPPQIHRAPNQNQAAKRRHIHRILRPAPRNNLSPHSSRDSSLLLDKPRWTIPNTMDTILWLCLGDNLRKSPPQNKRNTMQPQCSASD
jgi:hypothetical protein